MSQDRIDFDGVGFEVLLEPGVEWGSVAGSIREPSAFVCCSVGNARRGVPQVGRVTGLGVRWEGEHASVEGVGFEAQVLRVARSRYAARVTKAEGTRAADLLEALSKLILGRERELAG